MSFERSAGVLLHPTSLPGRYGIGDFGQAAYDFVDFLFAGEQTLWQILPLGPTGYGDSPYQCFSSFAGNPLLVSPDRLVEDGYLPATAVATVPPFPEHEVDYGPVIEYKQGLLRQAFAHFRQHGTTEQQEDFELFCDRMAYWLDDYALFMAIKAQHVEVEGGVWNTWPQDIARRETEAMERWAKETAEEVQQYKFQQFLFFKQWLELKAYANERGIRIVGDIPIFVAFDSADVWANPELFYLDEDGSPTVIAGVPPDYFSETGQRWGNPLYRWEKMAEDDYTWWAARLHMCFVQADIVRIDHFRGFEAYWEIPTSEPTAVRGRWVPGPGPEFFEALRERLGELPIIAEDLGVITPGVVEMREQFGFPGMKVLQFAFGGDQKNEFLPYTYDKDCVVYTGTHDNETTVGWYVNASEKERDFVRRYLAVSGQDIAWDMIRLAHASVANFAVVPMQDLLSLGNEARMNFPGKVGGYWRWRFTSTTFRQRFPGIARGLADFAALYGRRPQEEEAAEEQRSGGAGERAQIGA